jgi:hypothetical protein
MSQERNEYIAAVMSGQLLFFCRDNDLPFESADELAPSADRWKIRSTTHAGIAKAMADQWNF